MIIYYDKIFKDTAEHKINYQETDDTGNMTLIGATEISPISLIHIANDGAKAILRTQTTDIFSQLPNNL